MTSTKVRSVAKVLRRIMRYMEALAILTPIIWFPIFLYQKRFDSAYLCAMLAIFIFVCSLVERRADKWQKVAEDWEKEAKQWQTFDAKINALQEGESITITKKDMAINYPVM